jgi:hypothetical protein
MDFDGTFMEISNKLSQIIRQNHKAVDHCVMNFLDDLEI